MDIENSGVITVEQLGQVLARQKMPLHQPAFWIFLASFIFRRPYIRLCDFGLGVWGSRLEVDGLGLMNWSLGFEV